MVMNMAAATVTPPSGVSDEGRESIVKLKEQGADEAVARLCAMKAKLRASPVSISDFDSRDWIKSVDDIVQDRKKFEFLAGVAGDTGMGKTSLLNTLVHEAADIAPSSQNGACTAAVCCFKYKEPDDEKMPFEAVIKYKSKNTVDAEVQAVFQDFAALQERRQIDGPDSVQSDEQQHIDNQIANISGWSGFSSAQLHEFYEAGILDAITSTCKESQQLFDKPERGKTFTITAPNPQSFVRKCKPYVGSAGVPKNQPLRWPIVERVNILLPSPFLRECPGLVLVDLPGEMDANDSRSEVARKFYSKVDRLMVVTPSDRAFDNKTTANFIRDDRVYDIEAEGNADKDFLAVVISKIDQMDWRKFISTELVPDPEDAAFLLPSLFESLESKEQDYKQLSAQIRTMKREASDSESELGDSMDHRKRGRCKSSEDAQKEHSSLLRERNNLKQEIQKLTAQCIRGSVDFRSRDSMQKFKEHFDSVRNKYRKGPKADTKIAVLPVSSFAQQSLAAGEPKPGFTDSELTGFQGLKNWIIQASLTRREDHADNILHRCLILFDAIEGWIHDDWVSFYRLAPSEFNTIRSILDAKREELRQTLRRMDERFDKWFKRSQPFKAHGKKQPELIENFPGLVTTFKKNQGRQVHWSTYDACLRRGGQAYKTTLNPPVIHDWSSTLFSFYWGRHAQDWGEAFSKQLPEFVNSRVKDQARIVIANHEQLICTAASLPEQYKEAFEKNAYKIDTYLRQYVSTVQGFIREFRQRCSDIREESRSELLMSLQPVFIDASKISGKGKGKRQVEAVEAFARTNTGTIIDNFGRGIHKKLLQARKVAISDLKSCHDKLCERIWGLELKVAQQVCSSTKELKPATDAMTDNLKTSMLPDVDTWRKYWKNLKSRIPDRKMQPYTEDDEGLSGNEESNDELFDDSHMLDVTKSRETLKGSKNSVTKLPVTVPGPPQPQTNAAPKASQVKAKAKAKTKATGKPGATVKRAVSMAKTAKKPITLPTVIAPSDVRSGPRPKNEEDSDNDEPLSSL